MANLVEELGKLNYGKDLAESLASIGKTLGESRRTKEAQGLMSELMTKIRDPQTNPVDVLGRGIGDIFQKLSGTEEGQQALKTFQTQMGVSGELDKQRRTGISVVPYGAEQVSTTFNNQGKPVTEQLYDNAKTQSSKSLIEVMPIDEVKRQGLKTSINYGGKTGELLWYGSKDPKTGVWYATRAQEVSGNISTNKTPGGVEATRYTEHFLTIVDLSGKPDIKVISAQRGNLLDSKKEVARQLKVYLQGGGRVLGMVGQERKSVFGKIISDVGKMFGVSQFANWNQFISAYDALLKDPEKVAQFKNNIAEADPNLDLAGVDVRIRNMVAGYVDVESRYQSLLNDIEQNAGSTEQSSTGKGTKPTGRLDLRHVLK